LEVRHETLSITSIRAAESRDRRYALSDGNCLSVQMVPTGSNRWRYRYRYADRAKHDPAPSQLQEPRVRQNVLFEFGSAARIAQNRGAPHTAPVPMTRVLPSFH